MALEMSWQPHLHRRKSGPPLGLKNLGNSCYLNSVLQCLTYTPPLANFCLRNQHSSLCGSASGTADCPFCILERRIVRSLSIDVPLDSPSKIHTSLRIFAKHFRCGHQEDAHEFLRYVIDACHNTCLKLLKERKLRNGNIPNGVTDSHFFPETIVKEIFGGALQSEVKCLSCGAESRKTDEIMDISLDLFQSSSLKDALRRFFQPEVLDGSNKYNCEKCKKLSEARKQMSVLRAPNILVIQLKRFEGILGLKIDRTIAFEEVLTLSSYMCKASQDPQPEYSLFGTIVHSGYSPESGHYYAYIKDATGRWYCCNDAYVSVSTLQEVLSERVYILFFSRTNQRPKLAKTGLPHNGKKSSPVSNGHAVSVKHNESAASKPSSTKPAPAKSQGAHQSEQETLVTSKSDKVPSNTGVKFDLKRTTSKMNNGNGNGNLKVHNNGSVTKQNGFMSSTSEYNEESRVRGKQQMQSISNGNGSSGDKSSNVADCGRKCASSPDGNKMTQRIGDGSPKMKVHDENGRESSTGGRGSDSNHASHSGHDGCSFDIPAHKRKSWNSEKVEAAVPTVSSKLSRLGSSSVAEVTKFKEKLAREATAELRSCVWIDEVHSFMQARKRLCKQSTGNAPNTIELKKQLIADAKKTFISQLPESLKEHLIGRLRSFAEGKHSSDI